LPISLAGSHPAPGSIVEIRFTEYRGYHLTIDQKGQLATASEHDADSYNTAWAVMRIEPRMTVILSDGRRATFSLAGAAGIIPERRCPTQRAQPSIPRLIKTN